jgi:tetratricopeptide (TPR) repeat protein/signal transduction histidine kinase
MFFRRHIFVFLLGIIAQPVLAQNTRIDSLKVLAKSLRGEAQIDVLNKLAFELGTIDITQSNEELAKAFRLSEELNYKKGTAEALLCKAINEYSVGNDMLSRATFQKSIAISEQIKDKDLRGFTWAYLGLNYQNLDQLDSANYCFSKSIELLKESKNLYYLSFLYLVLSDYYGLTFKPDEQFVYLEKCWNIRIKLNDKYSLPYIGKRMASYYFRKGENATALSYLTKSQEALGKDTIDNEGISVIYQQRALIYTSEGDYQSALSLFYKAKKFYEKNSFPLELTHLLLESGEVLEEINNYEASLKNYFEALKIAQANHYELERAKILIRISWVYLFLEQYTFSKEYAQKAIEVASKRNHQFEEAAGYNLLGLIMDQMNKMEEALSYFNRALEIREKIKDQAGIAGTTYNMGILFEKHKNYKKALELQLTSLAMEESLNHKIGMAYSYEGLGNLYTEMGDFKKAEFYLVKGELLARKIKAGNVLINIYKYRRELLVKQFKLNEALRYSYFYENSKDSIFNKNLANRISAIQNLFQIEQRDKDLELQNEKLTRQMSQIQQQRIIIFSGAVGFLVICFVSVIQYRNHRKVKQLNQAISKQNNELNERQDEIAAQNEELIQSTEEVMAQRDLLSVQYAKLEDAQQIIESQNQEIKPRNENLELEVEERTKELVEYNHQLEQFAFVSSHNLRAPVARILGLGQLLELTNRNTEDEKTIHQALITTTRELDRVVKDLNLILEVKKNSNALLTEILLEDELKLILINLGKEIEETKTIIQTH